MTVKLFQDVAGTIPAVLPGQPVGFIKRTKGSDDAKQATALSKPTYARWPKVGMHTLQNQNHWDTFPLGIVNNSITQNSFVVAAGADGLRQEILEVGREDGLPYIILHATGTNGTGSTKFLNTMNTNSDPLAADFQKIGLSVRAKLISGVLRPQNDGPALNLYANFYDETNANVTGGTYVAPVGAEEALYVAAFNRPVGAVKLGNRGVYVRVPAGGTVDAVYKLKALHVARTAGDLVQPYQLVTSPNDITQLGIPDLWHLYNDGTDALNVMLPAGTYGLATIGIDRQIVIGTFVSDGTTPVNILRHERQLDVCYRLGAYSAAEELAIRDAWGRKYA